MRPPSDTTIPSDGPLSAPPLSIPRTAPLPRTSLAHVGPPALVRRILSDSRTAFLAKFSDTQFLLIEVNGLESPIASGLAENASSAEAEFLSNPDALAFATVTNQKIGSTDAKKAPGPDATQLYRMLRDGPGIFVVPLRRRVDVMRAFPNRVTVGRARNSDVVLRESSVSKFHAWFERDGNEFFVADARSKNATRLNHEELEPIRLRRISHGDQISFGKVVCTLIAPEVLWDTLSKALPRASNWPPRQE